MISRIEALRYRCFRELNVELGHYHVLAGANGSGKSTLLDIPLLFSDMISRGMMAAFLETPSTFGGARARTLTELVHCYQGEYFSFAFEAILPKHIVRDLVGRATKSMQADEKKWPHSLRYEIRLHIFNKAELHVAGEFLYILPTHISRPPNGWGWDIGSKRPSNWRTIIEREAGEATNVKAEYIKQNDFSLRLQPGQLALANIPQDNHLFPAAVWFRQLLETGIVKYEPSSAALRQAAAPGQPNTIRSNASNLPWLILRLQEQRPDFFEAWVEHVKLALPNLEAVEAVQREEDYYTYLKLSYQGGYSVTSSGLSDGTLRILAMTVLPYLSEAAGIICLEEPENGIHPRGVELVLQSLSSMYNSQVWITTHSPIVLANTELKSIIVMRPGDNGSVEAIPGDQHPNLRDWQGGVDLGTLFAAGVLG